MYACTRARSTAQAAAQLAARRAAGIGSRWRPKPAPRPLQAAPSLRGLVLPAGRALAPTVGAFVAAVRAAAEVEQLRVDARANVLAVVDVLARRASWELLTSWPTWQTLQTETDLSRASVARWLAWLRRHGWLAIVESGSTPRTRPMALAQGVDGNRAAVYALLVPAPAAPQPAALGTERHAELDVDERTGEILTGPNQALERASRGTSETPTGSRREPRTTHLGYRRNAYARANVHAGLPLPRTAAKTKADRIAACVALCAMLPLFRTRSPRLWAHLLRPWFDAGWNAYDIAWHLDHKPTSGRPGGPGDPNRAEPWPYAWSKTSDIRNATGWVLTRLRAWNTTPTTLASADAGGEATQTTSTQAGASDGRGADGGAGEIPLSMSQRLAAARVEQLAAQRARADADAARQANAVRGDTVHRHADAARAILHAARRAAAHNATP